ncbi:DinB family protein [Geochorda subterranea]|uniref:DinB family protein n=1 Tax=Geochorda subterranea TaxID=3109564 RepID=A0ABZ1BP23_9FIRM|nr:DinB family protein [Limnochorda sp. LNt]WRP14552.1 DinB family protein [Limnochorda sp. LNt]
MPTSAVSGHHDGAGEALRRMLQTSVDGLLALIQDLGEEELAARPHGLASVLWQIGHVAVCDAQLALQVGHPLDIPEGWEALFAMGASGEGPLPSQEAVVALLREANDDLVRLSGADLARSVTTPSGRTNPLAYRLMFLTVPSRAPRGQDHDAAGAPWQAEALGLSGCRMGRRARLRGTVGCDGASSCSCRACGAKTKAWWC